MDDNFNFQAFQEEVENDGILPDEDTDEEDELAGSGMHVEGADTEEDEETPIESDL
jgi:hypothetical protein